MDGGVRHASTSGEGSRMSNRVVVKLCDQCEEHWVPRAVVAISEDRQWLVVLDSRTVIGPLWDVFECDGCDYIYSDHTRDTGQSADEVLANWLKEREG